MTFNSYAMITRLALDACEWLLFEEMNSLVVLLAILGATTVHLVHAFTTTMAPERGEKLAIASVVPINTRPKQPPVCEAKWAH